MSVLSAEVEETNVVVVENGDVVVVEVDCW